MDDILEWYYNTFDEIVVKYLKEYSEDYVQLQIALNELLNQNSWLQTFYDNSNEIIITEPMHKVLINYKNLSNRIEHLERKEFCIFGSLYSLPIAQEINARKKLIESYKNLLVK